MTTIFKPILFSTEMVQAILAGRKTQTRRIIKSNHESGLFQVCFDNIGNITSIDSLDWDEATLNTSNDILPKYLPGDIIWVRETFLKPPITAFGTEFIYKATFDRTVCGWKPSIHMPKAAARIFLKVTNVRCERLQDISNEDAISEGIYLSYAQQQNSSKELVYFRNYINNQLEFISATKSFETLWMKINGKESWDKNPWVFVYDFEVIEKPKNFLT